MYLNTWLEDVSRVPLACGRELTQLCSRQATSEESLQHRDLHGCIHTDTSTSPGIRVWVIVNMSLHVLQWHRSVRVQLKLMRVVSVQVLFLGNPYQ